MNGANARPSTHSPSELTDAHIDRLWLRMAKMYGHRWVSSYGETDDGTWRTGLQGLTPTQIGAGIAKCLQRRSRDGSEDWPPTLSEFRAMCLPPVVDPIHRDYVALPKPEVDPNVVQASIAKMRALLHGNPDREPGNDDYPPNGRDELP